MDLNGSIYQFNNITRYFLIAYVVALTFGYSTGFVFLKEATQLEPTGIEQNYLGNKDQAKSNNKSMKFKMTFRELLTTIHTHSISISFIFLSLGVILLFTTLPPLLKKCLLIEPFISIILTFGGIWVMWEGIHWFRYVVMISGILLNLSLFVMVIIILWQLLFFRSTS